MKTPWPTRFALVSALCLLAAWLQLEPARAAADRVHREFREVDTLFANPGQGWMNAARTASNQTRFPCSVNYVRFNWADMEPEPGRFNWRLLDDAIAAAKPRGGTVGFRVMTCNAHSAGYYSSPQWLFDAGCKGFEYLRGGTDITSGGKRIPRIEPDYADPLYLARHGDFLAALGKRYDGHPAIEFVDIGSYGIWGEWHTPHPVSVAVRQQIVDLYLRAFPRTPLVFMSEDAEVLKYALEKGTGLRRDGVGSPWHEQNWIGSKKYAAVDRMADTWKRAPVIFEWFGNYDYLQEKKWSFDAAVNFMLSNHVTLINDNVGKVPLEAMPQLQKLARLAGARFVLRELSHETALKPGAPLHLDMKWANVGVGKLHRKFILHLALVDSQGHTAFATQAHTDPRDWLPGEHTVVETIVIPRGLPPGEYRVDLGLLEPTPGRPPFRLAIDVPEQDGKYSVSTLTIR